MIDKLFRKENLNIWLAPAFLIITTILLLIFNIYAGIVGILLSIVAVFAAAETINKKDSMYKEYVDKLDIYFEGLSKKAIFNMPFSIMMLNSRGELIWYNSVLKNIVGRKESLIDEHVDEVLPGLSKQLVKDTDHQVFEFAYEQKDYEIHTSYLEKEKIILIYMIDETEKIDTLIKYENERPVILNIRLDNIDELNSNISSEKRPIVYAEIDTIITGYFHKYSSFIKKNENGKYYAVTHLSSLREMTEDKFSFVEQVRNINSGNTIAPTLSIGISYEEENLRQNEKSSNAAVDIALGRGGDQIVVKKGDELEYFGGKNQATEKRTKVRSRVIAHALAQLINKSTDVFISGHINPDMDSLGSAIGIWHAVTERNKKAYIILSEVTPAIKNIYNYAIKNIEGLEDHIISPEQAMDRVRPSSLYIVTDNHRKNSTEAPDLFDATKSVVVIDHHRRGNDYIDNVALSYIEPSSSSASELVTEMLMYMDDNTKIGKSVADALLSGITVDTKNFTQQTSARTFEAATILKQAGADTNIVNKLFVEDLKTIKYKSEIISGANVFKDKFIIGTFDKDTEGSSLIASQAANELITIEDIEASFVLTRHHDKTHISARSNENVSVQLIMEKLDGGGHRNMAATQLDMTIEEAKKLLKKAIMEYIEEEKA